MQPSQAPTTTTDLKNPWYQTRLGILVVRISVMRMHITIPCYSKKKALFNSILIMKVQP